MPRFRRLSVLVLALVLASSLAAAAPRRPAWKPPAASASAETVVARLWEWLTAVWTKAGCILDPNGGCTNSAGSAPSPEGRGEAGCGIDPREEDCIIDPNGGS